MATATSLGDYLKDRRARLDPVTFGTWYSWLEQGRSGAPPADVLNRIARAMLLTDAQRDDLFLLGLARPPGLRYKIVGSLTLRLQRVLDAMGQSPVLLRTAFWDVVAWSEAAAVVLLDFAHAPIRQRNLLRLVFTDPCLRSSPPDWHATAIVVAAVRADVTRASALRDGLPLIDELQRISPEFAPISAKKNDLRGNNSREMTETLRNPWLGSIRLDFSGFSVAGRRDLDLAVSTSGTARDAGLIATLTAGCDG